MATDYRFSSLAEARAALVSLRDAGVTRTARGMSLHQALTHCAQSLEFSLTGFPQEKSLLFRRTAGRLAAALFTRRGYLKHDLAAVVPGAEAIAPEGDLAAAWTRLLTAIDRFEQHQGPLREHFAFGAQDKASLGRLQAMHLADHLSAVAG